MDQEQERDLGAFTRDELILLGHYANPVASEVEREHNEFKQLLESLRDEELEADLRWLCEVQGAGLLSADARRVLDIAERDVLHRQALERAFWARSERLHREKYQRLEATLHRLYGVGLNAPERYARWIEQLEEHALLMTSSGEEIEGLKAELIRRLDAYRRRTRHRRTRGRRAGSRSYNPEYRQTIVEDYLRLRALGVPQEKAADRTGHALKTLRNWAEELGINFI